MRKVRMRTSMAGPDGVHAINSEPELDDKLAASLVAGGNAEYVDEPKAASKKSAEDDTEMETEGPTETASRRSSGSRHVRKS